MKWVRAAILAILLLDALNEGFKFWGLDVNTFLAPFD